jgi:hypothetical protein
MNIPYIKKFDSDEKLLNPLLENYINDSPNRSERHRKPSRFHNNKKGIHLTIVKKYRYKRITQLIICDGGIKQINHYILCN